MIEVRVKIIQGARVPKFDKQLNFATASALTAVAKESQTAVIRDVESTFTVRNNWDKPSNKFGVRITPATKTDLTAAVGTAADWLNLHEIGQVKTPQGNFIAIPTGNVRRTKRDIIQRAQRPKALLGKRDFLLKTKAGRTLLYQRRGRGKNSRMIAMYVMQKKAPTKKQSTMLQPVELTVKRRFGAIFLQQMQRAFSTSR